MGKILSVTILSLIVLPLLLSLLLDIPGVQNFVVHKAAQMASRALETTVSIDRVDIGLFNKVRVKGFYVEDYQRDTLLYVGHLDAFVTNFGLFGGELTFSRAEIAGAKLYLRDTPQGEMNIKQIVDRISNPDAPKKGNFRMKLTKASIKDLEFCLDRSVGGERDYGIDFSHMHLSDIQARIDDFTIDGSAIHTTIAALSARERSGFVLDHLAGRFFLTSGCIGFEHTSIVTSRSNITIPYISLAGNSWADYKDFIGEVRLDGALRKTSVSTDDIAYFAPALRDWHVQFSNIDVEIAGVVSDFTTQVRSLQIGAGTYLTAQAKITGLPDMEQTHFDLTIPRITSTGREVDVLARSIAGRRLSPQLIRILGNAGKVDVGARFEGQLSSFEMQVGVATGVGAVNCSLLVKPLRGGRRSVRGDVSTRNLRVGQLLGREDLLGMASLRARVDGEVGQGSTDAEVSGELSQLGFNGYVYDSIRLEGRLRNKGFDGRVISVDPNLNFDFFGLVDFNDSIPQYDFTLDLHCADLVKLHVNRRDSISQLSGLVVAKGSGRSLDDMNGRLQVTNAIYKYNDQQVHTKRMTLLGENSAQSKFVELTSDFADVTFRSKTSYKTIFEYLRRSAWKYLPMLGSGDADKSRATTKAAMADDYSLLSVIIRDINPITEAISAGLQVADGTSLRLLFNPASDKLSLRASSQYIERRRMLATRLNINASNQGDSLNLYASTEDLYVGGMHFPHLSVTGGAKQGRVFVSAGFNDTVSHVSALLSLRAEVADENGPDGRVVNVSILPSHISRGSKTWQIFARQIQMDTARVVINRFFVMNSDQELVINGVASRSRDDSVTLRLRNFDLASFTQVVANMGYAIEGRTNGEATIKSALRGGEFTADILFDSLRVNNMSAPPLRLTSGWDFSRNRAGVTVTDRKNDKTLIQGFYDPAQVRYYARVTVDSLNLALLNPILTGVIGNTQGHASADLTLQGRHREAELTGQIHVANMATTVDFTQVTYSLPSAVLEVKDSRMRAVNTPVYDPLGNRGRLDFELNLQHLSNIAYDVRIAPQQMLVLNTTERDNSLFYGKIFASGNAHISGDKGFVNMDVTASTDGNSSFYMPLNNQSDLSNADFVTFVQPVKIDTADLLARKKMLFERARRQKTSAASQMNISLALDVGPNLEFQMPISGSTIKARGDGALNLQINPRSNVFEMYGDYTISEGSYNFSLENLLTRKFVIENGSTIQWTGSPMDAMLHIDAVYNVKASLQPLLQGMYGEDSDNRASSDRSVPVECVIKLRDRLTDPSITFDVVVPAADPEMQSVITNVLSSPETVDTQFAYLLLFNSFMAENSTTNSNIGASVGAGAGLEFLSNMVNNWLQNDYSIVIRYRPKSELTSDEVDFGLSKSLINNRLFVEVEGNYVVDNKQAVNGSMSNFMGEAYVTYLIDRSGSLKLKAFTQTIDRFDENQGLQETGIGIYYKEDFNNFRDLRQRVKDRFVNKKRRALRQTKAAAKTEAKAAAKAEAKKAAQSGDTIRPPQTVDKKTRD